jgi:hypothetical protein
MRISKTDPFTGKTNTLELDITLDQYGRIQTGVELIQNIVPHLSPDEREFLITGIVGDSWDQIFPESKEVTND